jgi:hypothetical protein
MPILRCFSLVPAAAEPFAKIDTTYVDFFAGIRSKTSCVHLAMLSRATVFVIAMSEFTWADTGVELAPRAGVAYQDATDAFVGGAVRIAPPTSPITVEPTFDYVFDSKQTLYQLGGNLLYHVPIDDRFAAFGGVGLTMTSFKLADNTMGVDNEGYRVGMKVIAGARLDLPWVSPYVQLEQGIGEYHLSAVTGGIAFRARERRGTAQPPEPLRFSITPYIANHIAGDIQSGRAGLGVALAYQIAEHIGVELDAELNGHFFVDGDVADLVPMGVDLNTRGMFATASVVVPYCLRDKMFGTWCPYASAGAGAIRATFEGNAFMPGTESFSAKQTNLALTGGLGVTHVFTRHIGFRIDARYFRALVDEDAHEGGYFEDYGFLRLSGGVTIGF